MNLTHIYLTIIACLLCMANFQAQNGIVKNFNVENGLPQNHVNLLSFDSNNRLWIKTNAGLCVFDGQMIKKLPTDTIATVLEHLWYKNTRYMYALSDKMGLYKYDINNFKVFKNENELLTPNSNIFVKTPYLSRQNDIEPNLNSSSQWEAHLKKNIRNRKGYNLSDSNNYIELAIRTSDRENIISMDKNLQWWLHNILNHKIALKSDIPKDLYLNGFFFNDESDVYVLYNYSIYKIVLLCDSLLSKRILKGVSLSKENAIITGTFNKENGNFYFGSALYGLYEVKPTIFDTFVHEESDDFSLNFEHSTAYYNQGLMADGKILINNYLIKDLEKIKLFNKTKDPYPIALNYVDKQGWLWYEEREWVYIVENNEKYCISKAGVESGYNSVVQGPNSNTYYMLNNNSIVEIKNTIHVSTIDLAQFGIQKNEAGRFIYKCENENYFLLTNKFVYQIDLNRKKCNKITSLPEATYRNISGVKDSLYFLGTYGQGFYLYDGKTWIAMPLDKRGFLKFAHVALTDANGHVWISTNNGLFRTRLEDLENYFHGKSQDVFYYYYDKSSGFLTDEFNGGVLTPALNLKDGRMSFSSMNGLVQFDPLSVPVLFPDGLLKINSIQLNENVVDSVAQSLCISQDIKDIHIEIGPVYYGHPYNLILEYKLSGHNEKWKSLDQNRYIHLQNLYHGEHTVHIRIRVGFGQEDFKYLTYKIKVQPYFYQTLWFYSFVTLSLLLSILLGFKWFSRFTIIKNKKLQRIIKEQKEDLVQSNYTLQERIKQNDLFQSIFVHDIKSPLRFIESNSDLLLKNKDKIDQSVVFKQLHHIHEASSKIKRFVDEAVLWMNIRNGDFYMQKADFLICALFFDVRNFHAENEKIIKGDVVIHIECKKEFFVNSDPVFIETILRNLLSNSLKHTQNGNITLYAQKLDHKSFRIGCRDTGAGMTPEIVEMLMSPDYHGNSIRHDSFRLGYVIIKELVKILEGKLHIHSYLNKGTDVYIDFNTNK